MPDAQAAPPTYLIGGFGSALWPRYHEYVPKRSLISHGVELIRHVIPQVIRPIRSLWHEVIGFLFLSLAFLGGLSGFRAARNFDGSPEHLFRLILTGFFVLVMAGYGISSFLRARRISRS
jgi:hypothetical protein